MKIPIARPTCLPVGVNYGAPLLPHHTVIPLPRLLVQWLPHCTLISTFNGVAQIYNRATDNVLWGTICIQISFCKVYVFINVLAYTQIPRGIYKATMPPYLVTLLPSLPCYPTQLPYYPTLLHHLPYLVTLVP